LVYDYVEVYLVDQHLSPDQSRTIGGGEKGGGEPAQESLESMKEAGMYHAEENEIKLRSAFVEASGNSVRRYTTYPIF
jgi:hypothetical protein